MKISYPYRCLCVAAALLLSAAGFDVRADHTVSVSTSGCANVNTATYPDDAVLTLTAKPLSGWQFARWSDGSTANPYTLTVTQDTTLVAEFAELPQPPVEPDPVIVPQPTFSLRTGSVGCSTFTENDYPQNATFTFAATPLSNQVFKRWSDGNTCNPRTLTLTQDTVLLAEFDYAPTVTHYAVIRADQCAEALQDDYLHGSELTLYAVADVGYSFLQWSDDVTDNPRVMTLLSDTMLTAVFEYHGLDTVIVSDDADASDQLIGPQTHIIVMPAGHLTINQPLTAASLELQYGLNDHAQLTGIEDLTVGSAEVALSLASARQWQAFAVPFAVSVASGIRVEGAESAARYGYDYIIDEYDGSLRAATQDGWTRLASSATLQPGKLYMLYSAAATEWRMAAAVPETLSETTQVAVAAYPSAIGAHHSGWNGVANTLYRETESSLSGVQYLTTYNNLLGVYEVQPMSGTTLAAVQPFFVQAPAAGTILFAQPAGAAPRYMQQSDEPLLSCVLSLASDEYTDKAYLTAQTDKEDVYTIGHDLQKMQSANASVPQLWLEAYSNRLAAYELPLTGSTAIVPIGLYAPTAGEYMLNANMQTKACTLTLMHDGTPVAELGEQPVTRMLEQGDNMGYSIRIDKAPSVVTGLVESSAMHGGQKFLRDGQLFILLPDGSKISATGAKVE